MREQTRCPACRLPGPECLCEQITAAPCDLELVILRHTLESKRNSNTGRLAAKALQGASLIEYASPHSIWDPRVLSQPETWLLYPRPGAALPPSLPKRLVVLDASWSQARRMAQRIPALRRMPTLALPPPTRALPRLRTGSRAEQMSTAESIIASLRALGQHAPADHLEALLRELVRRFSLPQRRGQQGKNSHESPAQPVLSSLASHRRNHL